MWSVGVPDPSPVRPSPSASFCHAEPGRFVLFVERRDEPYAQRTYSEVASRRRGRAVVSRGEVFDRNRPLLFSMAYRMTGSVMDAEDAVQEAYLRWQRASEDEVRSPSAYLSKVVTRLCIDRLRSARVRREQYVGPWLPEPLLGEQAKEIAGKAELEDSLSMAFLVLLESLTPVERAVFLLREVFAYEYAEIASLVGKSEANCRQISRRARQSLAARRPRFESSPQQEERLMESFLQQASEATWRPCSSCSPRT